jgi:RHS repeat-associated protein
MPVTSFYKVGSRMVGEQTDGGTRINYVTDALGSIVQAIDENHNTTYTARYKPFGDVLSSTGTAPAFTWVGSLGYLQAAGRPHTEFYVRARIYSKMEGRWTTVDPLWPSETSLLYAGASPISNVDPTGLLHYQTAQNGTCDYYGITCGNLSWTINWILEPKEMSFSGYVVQYISNTYSAMTCGKLPGPNGQCNPASYFERWTVNKGKILPGNLDVWGLGDYGPCTYGGDQKSPGSKKVGYARLVSAKDLGGKWYGEKDPKHNHCAGLLETTDSVPKWSNKGALYREMWITWACCGRGGDHCPGKYLAQPSYYCGS